MERLRENHNTGWARRQTKSRRAGGRYHKAMPKPIPFYVVDAFTREPFAGNPAGVFVDDDARLSDEQMRLMAGEVHLESAFVLPPSPEAEGRADFRLRYWTGVMEVPLCGHATVAALTALFQSGRLCFSGNASVRTLRVETSVGVLTVDVTRNPNRDGDNPVWVTLHQNAPTFGERLDIGMVAKVFWALGKHAPEAVPVPGLPRQVVSTGTPWLFVPVVNRFAVDGTPKDWNTITALSQETGSFGIYVFTIEPGDKNRVQTWGRCFAPIVGLNEDPVTGSGTGALGAYLAHHGVLPISDANGDANFTAYQGFAGGRGGTVEVGVSRDTSGTLGVRVTGEAVVIAEGSFRV